ncbi:DUF4062 domain-containing protein [Acinetobacter apis]|uniref:DUF4062 domain-containing protein n=1 Tax=Acinetobacter apis TaxID=1229165 RepID=A0A217EHJ3_9GAMM|nr:DUF4062 domain-containing protein [Acinetobacter apis]SNQ29827.1 protein of unknown function [Acinetobacter apis]
MDDRKFQVFISTSGPEMAPEYSILCQTLVTMGYFAWGLQQRCEDTEHFARRQIDECDYFVVLISQSYGDLSSSHLSYMQLEYIYAMARQKPVVAFIDMSDACLAIDAQYKRDERQPLPVFRHLIQHDLTCVFPYYGLDDLESKVRARMPEMDIYYPAQGWVRSANTRALHDEIQQLKHRIKQFERRQALQTGLVSQFTSVQLTDIFDLEYHVNAYKNESDRYQKIKCSKRIVWLDLVKILGQCFIQPQAEEQFEQCLNYYLTQMVWNEHYLFDAKITGISDIEVHVKSLYTIKIQMKQNEWIIPIGRDHRYKLIWQVTSETQALLKKEQEARQ